ncbi:hypothetical protein GCM10017044_14230 [Kordiimonas sediminis]|uniref:Sulfur carrier protein FdhD n=1 Tax=Kordiimonas sediminis TaxID=1735581 RepID=A0A919ASB1_9PROT|nr:formate dehydrogenase accessory sulfurtransferase FdhD [Kordiimonas sediminis]GHF20512.1 hypothetical protein GCM10017044_14230 [Kordiimonas sediminis]
MSNQTKDGKIACKPPVTTLAGDILLKGQHITPTKSEQATWHIPVEVPVAFIIRGRTAAIMLATPDDLTDFALGFALSDGIIDRPDELKHIRIDTRTNGIDIHLTLKEDREKRFLLRSDRRTMAGTSSCGLCGIDGEDRLYRQLPRLSPQKTIELSAINTALQMFPDMQPLRRLNRSVHGAAWATPTGDLIAGKEDVGRHNAVDKLIGHLLHKNSTLPQGFLVLSSRCSFEIIEKCARAGIGALVCLSAPTSFAAQRAANAGITLYTTTPDGVMRF